jgi:Domain of unknown function (DUF6438)
MKSLIFYFSLVIVVFSAGCSTHKGISAKSTIKYNRTACYGTCPIYELTIDGKGKAIFVGERFTDKLGTWEKDLDKETCSELFNLLSSVAWDTLSDEYPAYISDVPSTIYHYANKTHDKEVIVSGTHPAILDKVATQLNNIVDSEGWTNMNLK